MALVPENLEKYFRTKKGLLMKDNNYDTILNAHLREQMQIGKKEDIGSVELLNSPNPHFFTITQDTCELAFANSCWKNLRDNEKARTIYLYINKYMKENFPNHEVPVLNFIPSKEHKCLEVDAMYCEPHGFRKPYVYINPNILSNAEGLQVANLVAHELQHLYDFYETKSKTIPFLKRYYVEDKENYEECIMNLPLDGMIRNYKTGKYETVTPRLRQLILTAKTRIAPIISTCKVQRLHAVSNESQMYEFLQHVAYRRSPLEQRAYNTGAYVAENIYNHINNLHIANNNDSEFVERSKNSIHFTTTQAKEMKKLTGMPAHQICDLFARLKYYSNLAQLQLDKYKAKAVSLQNEALALASHACQKRMESIEQSLRNL